LGLPPCIHDWAALAAYVLVIPNPRLWVDRLANCAQETERGEIMFGRVLLAPAHERTDRGGSCIEQCDGIFLHQIPETIPVRKVRCSLIHHDRCAIRQWTIDDVAVACYPANIRGAPVHVVILEIEYPLVSERRSRQIAASGMQLPLGLASCPAC